MIHYIVTPFSIATDLAYSQNIGHGKSWNTHIQPLIEKGLTVQEAHCDYLYSQDRMSYRFSAFKHICLNRMLEATSQLDDQDWKWFIYTTEDMPKHHFDTLESLVGSIPQIEIVKIPYGTNLSKMAVEYYANVDTNRKHSTTRLDDDDGVPTDLFSRVREFSESIDTPFIYSNPKVKTVNLSEDRIIEEGNVGNHPSMPASGLTAIDSNIYSYGNHVQIAKRHTIQCIRDFESTSDTLCGCDALHTTSFRRFSKKIF